MPVARSGGRSCSRRKILRATAVFFLALSAAVFVKPASASEFCDRFESFVNAKLTDRSARWVEVEWFGTPGVAKFGIECHHGGGTIAASFCTWLASHTSYERPDALPQDILSCRDYRFPKFAHWEEWKGAIELRQDSGNAALLQINLAASEHKTVRLTITPE
jgi:hypothetical protein